MTTLHRENEANDTFSTFQHLRVKNTKTEIRPSRWKVARNSLMFVYRLMLHIKHIQESVRSWGKLIMLEK
jgi:hypothetical protein